MCTAEPPAVSRLSCARAFVQLEEWEAYAPLSWDLRPLLRPHDAAAAVAGASFSTAARCGERVTDALRDTVTSAPELARLTQNLAAVHRDHTRGPGGRRLVYGAASQPRTPTCAANGA
jgi:hypothetical protein